ncbi:Chromatin-remodeling complex subunit ies6 [Neolecta irregularis DAH-3]|uniref:Chromatin-remodeling complex subunit ies6 n=1 Tax=Neolecta irregularis (strain DAH-3) TaxID=1198029 RepID=A0A1U7LIY4_NEOID|nr:Chromatin-remodeling complex subunit ies6 [Neolecta irregularis DAH-3]|eukprot:OLL22626.1 Chromatin-remodeling complex subunit ies6 [Neolecta irregularis DAH-3]
MSPPNGSVPPYDSIDLTIRHRPFKNPNYKRPTQKRIKTLKQILSSTSRTDFPPDFPTYTNIEAPPSLFPPKKWCDITGLPASYVDPYTKLRYHNKEIFGVVRKMGVSNAQMFLELRGANVILK